MPPDSLNYFLYILHHRAIDLKTPNWIYDKLLGSLVNHARCFCQLHDNV